MTVDVAQRSQELGRQISSTTGRRMTLAAAIGCAAVAGALAGAVTAPVAAADADLALLLRFMAVMKAAIVLAAAALVGWRLASPLPSWLAVGYTAAVALMAMSPGLIWSQSSLTLASALFHSGLLFGLVLAARDGFTKGR